MPVVRTDGRAGGRLVYGHVITKFSRMGSLPHFLTHGAPLRALRARELRYYFCYLKKLTMALNNPCTEHLLGGPRKRGTQRQFPPKYAENTF